VSSYVEPFGAAIVVLAIVLMGFLHALIAQASKGKPEGGATKRPR
jgi:hypothetical protein